MAGLISACVLALSMQAPLSAQLTGEPTGSVSISTAPQNLANLSLSDPRSPVLTSLYASFVSLQALDAHSTLSGLSAGMREANPAMRGVAENPASLVAVKAAAAVTTIWVSEKMRKRHPRGAVVLMVVLNSAVATVVARNYAMR
jgi:hypothetical protein